MTAGHRHSNKIFTGLSLGFLVCIFIFLWLGKYLWMPALLCIPFLLFGLSQPQILFYILVASIPWSAEIAVNASLATDFPDEPLMWLAAFIALTVIVRDRNAFRQPWLHSSLTVLLLLQLGWIVVSVIHSTDIVVSTKFLLAKGWYLGAFLFLPLFVLKEKKDWQTSALVFTVSSLLCILVIFVRHGFDGFTFDSINKNVQPFFRNHVTYSALLVCLLPGLFFYWRKTTSVFLKRFFLFLMLLGIAALYFSYARGAWLAFVVGIISFWLLKKRLLLFSFLLFFFITTGLAFWLGQNNRYVGFAHDYNTTVFHTDFSEHWSATYQMKDVSTAERFYRWIAGVRMAKEKLGTGWGPTTFYPTYQSYAVPAFKTWVSANPERSTVHNYFLLTLIEQGIPGLCLLLTLLCLFFYKAQQLYQKTADGFFRVSITVVAIIMAQLCTVNFLSDLVETDKTGSLFLLSFCFLIWAETKINQEKSGFGV